LSEYLSEEEQIEKMKSWWGEHGTLVMVAVVVTVLGIVGFRWYGGYSTEQVFDASRAYVAFTDADTEAKSAQLDNLAQAHGGSAYYVFALFHQAQAAAADGDYSAAEKLLQQAVEAADDELLTDLARIRLAKVQRALDRPDVALKTLNAVGNSGYKSWVLETKGDIHASRGEVKLAHESYQAAISSLVTGDQRPILQMKAQNTAPFADQYVQLSDNLEDALREAEETLNEAGKISAEVDPEITSDDSEGSSSDGIEQED